MRLLVAFVTLLAFVWRVEGIGPTYTVVAPSVVRPNSDYLVAVSAFGIGDQEQQDVELRIQGRSASSGQTIEIRQDTRVRSDQTEIVRLRIGDLGKGSYSLTARGTFPISFDQTQRLSYVHKGYSVFIQTDKAIYRPGNSVRFRAVVVTPQLKPSVVGSIDVTMTDGGGNIIRRWDRVFTTKGVFAADLLLSEVPVMGDWNITVDVSGQLFSRSFQVVEYVLPKFRVDISLPDYGILSEGTTRAVIRATYAHGGPVVGEATISVFPTFKSSTLQPFNFEPVRTVKEIQGQVEVPFEDLSSQLGLKEDFARIVVFDVKVKEASTGRIQNVTAVYNMFKYKEKMQLIKTSEAFRPGMPYTAYLKVAYQDDTPVADDLNSVSVKWGFSADLSSYNETQYVIPEDGIIEMQFMPPINGHADILGIEATYKDQVQWFSTIPTARSQSGLFIQSKLRTANPQVGKKVRIGVNSTAPLQSLSYAVFGRGKLVFADTIPAADDDHYNEIDFRATPDAAPRCRVILYSTINGEIIADAVEFEVDGTLSNSVEIFSSRRQTLPGKDVTVNVKTQPNSFVGLMAVEKSVSAFTPSHDITMSDVVSELRGYDSAIDPDFYPWFRIIRPDVGALFWHTGSSGSESAFRDSGTILLTNGRLQPGRRKSNNKVQVVHHGDNRPLGRPLPSPDDQVLTPDQGPGVVYESVTRPPLAGPYAFSKLPAPSDNLPKIYLQKDLPETWLFINTTTDLDGKASIPLKAPELANSSWTISGFSLDELHGMGITQEAGYLEIFQPFYVRVDLPYLVRRGEAVAIQMVVYNYLTREISAEVTLENTQDSAFLFGNKNVNEIDDGSEPDIELYRTKRVQIRPGRGTLVQFIITPIKVGLLDLKITAKSSVGQDILIKSLKVDAEGDTLTVNKPIFLDMRSKTSMERNITIRLPKHAVSDSQRIFITATADPLGPAMNNLKKLLPYPQGCGEQNLMRILPAAIISAYLDESELLNGEIASTARHLMETGYQRQLAYRLSDGSFTAFGPSYDRRGSTWITALTMSSLRQAQPFVDIDEGVISGAINWLVNHQEPTGAYPETGAIVNKRIQDNPVTMTAFVILCMLENKFSLDPNMRNSLNRGINYLAEKYDTIDGETDPYTLSVVTYTLQKSLHPLKDEAFTLLSSLATFKDGYKFWQLPLEDFEKENPWTQTPNSANIEMTGYALLSSLLADETGSNFDSNIPVVEWLFSQQNTDGGFASSSDTFVALNAIREFSRKLRIPERGSEINIQYTFQNTVRRMEINAASSTLLQRRILLPDTKEIRLRATGGGIGLVQVGYEFNVAVNGAWPSFVVNPLVFKATEPNQLKVSICANYIQDGSGTSSNMAVMEVNLPSGFTVDKDSLPALRRYKGVKRVDSERGDTKVILYFESLGRSEVCPTISAYRTYKVANQRPSSVLVYDYYDQSRRARAFYQADPTSLCDICDDCPIDADCGDRPTFLNLESFQFGTNVDLPGSAPGGTAMSMVAFLAFLMPILLL